ncbi:MAG: DUF192 domain-containing protein [Clostridiales bacterium]|nr:DUF192 domain-containing protein [Clostridiales bacterium]
MTVMVGQNTLAGHVKPANTFWKRFIGLMGKKQLNQGEGLLLFNCSSIHCFFMKVTIDVIYLSSDRKVLFIETLPPWKIGHFVRGAKHVLELPAGSAAGKISVGDTLTIEENTERKDTYA